MRRGLASLALGTTLLAGAGCYAAYDGPTGSSNAVAADSGATPTPTTPVDEAGTPSSNSNYGTAVVCTSGSNSSSRSGSTMAPGGTCISCHSQGEGPQFFIAGTVYPTAHEPDNCNGKSGVNVVITDSAGSVFTLPTNTAGNFACGNRASKGFPACTGLKPPYSAKVVSNGVERAMGAQQTTGDCNSCHTESGANSAPGRIMAP